jgi:acyl-CoA thioesterase I
MLSRIDSAVPRGTKLVLLQIGDNDSRRGVDPSQHTANIASIVGHSRALGAKVNGAHYRHAGQQLPSTWSSAPDG